MRKRPAVTVSVLGLLAFGAVRYSTLENDTARRENSAAHRENSAARRDNAARPQHGADPAGSSSENSRANLARTADAELDFEAALRPRRAEELARDQLLERGRLADNAPLNAPEDSHDPYAVPEGTELPPDTRERVNGQLVGLEPRYLVPVPESQRPTKAELDAWEAEAAEERARGPQPGPPDRDLLVGLLAAIRQVKENPALRLGLINSYLDEIAGLDDAETAEAMKKLDEARRESAQWAP